MSQSVIKVENIGKKYVLRHHQGQQYSSLRDAMVDGVKSAGRRVLRPRSGPAPGDSEEFWALRDVSFEVKAGERVAIIGRNGAGKSTLLKILSRITAPSSGRIRMRGRVASLLEVGTGFHPELTGRENIFLNGAILGMSKSEIVRNFDEIVAFAEVERFLDTPVKRYSSGMYVRLAFAVAAHLEPEILIVDEVLAVGDASFQKKCLNKMQQVGQEGRTVLFVSHNMSAITRLCDRGVLLEKGAVLQDGPAQAVIASYLGSGIGTTAERRWEGEERAPGNEIAKLRSVRVRDEAGETSDSLDIRKPVGVEMEFEVLTSGHILVPNYHFFNEEGLCVFIVNDQNPEWRHQARAAGRYRSTAWIPGNLLAEGFLIVGAALSTMDPVVVHFYERDAVAFQVVDSLDGDSARGDYAGAFPGVVRPLLQWDDARVENPISGAQPSPVNGQFNGSSALVSVHQEINP